MFFFANRIRNLLGPRFWLFLLPALGMVLLFKPAYAATVPAGFTDAFVGNTMSNPTAFEFSPDGRIFVTEQTGAVRVIKNGTLLTQPFLTVSTDSTGERGLLGIAFDPSFASNHFVYVYYTVPVTPPHNRLSRFTAAGDVAEDG